MTAIAFPIQHETVTYGVEPDVRMLDALFEREGILPVAGTTPLLVEALTPAQMQVRVKAGSAIVDFEYAPAAPQLDGGKRLFTLTADSLSGLPGNPGADWGTTFAAAAANPRLDRVVARVLDSNYDGSGLYGGQLHVIQGAAQPGVTLDNLLGAAAVPDNALLLANVLIRGGATDIVAGDIRSTLDVRKEAKAAGQLWEKIATTTLGSDAATVTLSGLSLADYEEIEVIVEDARTANTETHHGLAYLRFNGDVANNYAGGLSFHAVGTGISSHVFAAGSGIPIFLPSSSLSGGPGPANFRVQRPGDTAANPKKVYALNAGGGNLTTFIGLNAVGWWSSGAAITSITLAGYNSTAGAASNFKAGMKVTLLGRRVVTV